MVTDQEFDVLTTGVNPGLLELQCSTLGQETDHFVQFLSDREW